MLPFLIALSEINRPVDNIKEEEGKREEGSCIEINAFGSSRYDRFRWTGLLAGFDLGFQGSSHFNWFTITVKVGKFKVPR